MTRAGDGGGGHLLGRCLHRHTTNSNRLLRYRSGHAASHHPLEHLQHGVRVAARDTHLLQQRLCIAGTTSRAGRRLLLHTAARAARLILAPS